jgi:hypothetical protein
VLERVGEGVREHDAVGDGSRDRVRDGDHVIERVGDARGSWIASLTETPGNAEQSIQDSPIPNITMKSGDRRQGHNP